jgi:hypothetical protein
MRQPFDVYFEPPVAGPATHVLIMGAGDYPHLLGGSSGNPSTASDGMEQLTSPPLSARDLATWIATRFHNPAKPLASVALLVSEGTSTPFPDPLDATKSHDLLRADVPNAKLAIAEFFARGDQHEDNLLIFYFCGHGISGGDDTALLFSDYGANPLNPLSGAIDFRRLRSGLGRCKASEQVFFIDACRASSDTLLANLNYTGETVIAGGQRPITTNPLRAPVFYATLNGAKAYAQPGKVTVFTGALLKTLNDLGAEQDTGDWRVSTTRIQKAIEHLAEREGKAIERRQIPSSNDVSNIYLHFLQHEPNALVYVTTDPVTELAKGPLTYAVVGGEIQAAPPSGLNGGYWDLEIPAGVYDFRLDAPTARVAHRVVMPPFGYVEVK